MVQPVYPQLRKCRARRHLRLVPLPEVANRVAAPSDVDSEIVNLDNRRLLILVTAPHRRRREELANAVCENALALTLLRAMMTAHGASETGATRLPRCSCSKMYLALEMGDG
jgi:hypothetical protein